MAKLATASTPQIKNADSAGGNVFVILNQQRLDVASKIRPWNLAYKRLRENEGSCILFVPRSCELVVLCHFKKL